MHTILFIATIGLVALLLIAYLFIFLRRAGNFYLPGVRPPCVTWGAALLAIILVITTISTMGSPLLAILFITVFGVIIDLVNFVVTRIAKHTKKSTSLWQKIYRGGLTPVLITAIILTAGYINMTTVRRTDYTVKTHKLSRDYRIAYISDLHFGTTMGSPKLQKIANEISETSPDIVVLVGDITDESTEKDEMTEAFQILGRIKNNFGCFYVYGNHDRQSYSEDKHFTDTELKQAIEDAGITILQDELYPINNEIMLIGREDLSAGSGQRSSIETLTAQIPESMFRLVLDHQPRETQECQACGCDLQLSGHTHNGQIWPAGYISKLANDVLYGQKSMGTYQIIVSSGIAGWGFPIRTEGRSEWVLITLNAQNRH